MDWTPIYTGSFNFHQNPRPVVTLPNFTKRSIAVTITSSQSGIYWKRAGWLIPYLDGNKGKYRRIFLGTNLVTLSVFDLQCNFTFEPVLWLPNATILIAEASFEFVEDTLQRVEQKIDDISNFGQG